MHVKDDRIVIIALIPLCSGFNSVWRKVVAKCARRGCTCYYAVDVSTLEKSIT